jgi:hypothetical protein
MILSPAFFLVLKGRGSNRAVRVAYHFRLHRLRKNSDSSHDLKGCGFQPHRKSCKINPGFSRCGMVPTYRDEFFRSLFSLRGTIDATRASAIHVARKKMDSHQPKRSA